MRQPSVTLTNGMVELKVKSWKGFAYEIEASSDLVHWTRLTTLTNLTGTLQFADPDPDEHHASSTFRLSLLRPDAIVGK